MRFSFAVAAAVAVVAFVVPIKTLNRYRGEIVFTFKRSLAIEGYRKYATIIN